jgi:hypothetical protein
MATYAEYLKSQGASDDDIKLLDTVIGRKAYDAMQHQLADSTRRLGIADTDLKNYQTWFTNEATPAFESMKEAKIRAEAEAARARQVILSSQDEGLLKVAKEMGYDVEAPPARRTDSANPPTRTTDPASGFNPDHYFTRAEIQQIAAQEGEAIATAQDIAYEHRVLFPDKPLNFRDLRARSVKANKPVEQLWMEEFNVTAARAARQEKEKTEYETRLRTEGATAERQRLADTYGNPNVRPLAPSNSPFTMRPAANRDKQPWEIGENKLVNDRVERATKKLLEKTTTPVA